MIVRQASDIGCRGSVRQRSPRSRVDLVLRDPLALPLDPAQVSCRFLSGELMRFSEVMPARGWSAPGDHDLGHGQALSRTSRTDRGDA